MSQKLIIELDKNGLVKTGIPENMEMDIALSLLLECYLNLAKTVGVRHDCGVEGCTVAEKSKRIIASVERIIKSCDER